MAWRRHGAGRLDLIVLALLLAGCGGGGGGGAPAVPAGAIATVAGRPITADAFRTAQTLQAVDATTGDTGKAITRTRPPRLLRFDGPIDRCVRELRSIKGTAYLEGLPARGLRVQCVRTKLDIRQFSVNALLARRVTAAEAQRAGVTASRADVDGVLAASIAGLGGPSRLPLYTKLTGLTEADLRAQAQDAALTARLRQAVVTRAAGKVTEADVRAAFVHDRARLVTPERRVVRLIVVRGAADAAAAQRALRSGAPFATAARRWSIDRRSRARGGRLGRVTKLDLPPGLRTPVFSASAGTAVGPIAADGVHYLFRVDSVTPSTPLRYAAVKAALRQTLTDPNRLWAEWQRQVTRRWKRQIVCAPGYNVVALCGNEGPPIKRPAPVFPAGQQRPG